MSMRALLQGCRDQLINRLQLSKQQVDMRAPPGCPGAVAHDLFIALHPEDMTNGFISQGNDAVGIEDVCAIQVTISLLLPQVPQDMSTIGTHSLDLYDVEIKVKAALAGEGAYQALAIANERYILEANVNKFIEPLRWIRTDKPVARGAEWWQLEEGKASSMIELVKGYSLTMHFGNARRPQADITYIDNYS